MNRVIIDVYGDGSLVVEGKIGERVLVSLPENLLHTPIGGEEIRPWVKEMEKLGLDLVCDSPFEAVFEITELAVTKQE
jgi:hypothetical protein